MTNRLGQMERSHVVEDVNANAPGEATEAAPASLGGEMKSNFDKHTGSRSGGDPVENVTESLQTLMIAGCSVAAGAAIGWALAWALARRFQARFDWAVGWLGPLAAAVLLVQVGALDGVAAIASIGALVGLFGGHLAGGIALHIEDRRAGDDRAHQARERIGPHHVLLRRARRNRIGATKSDELAIGLTERGGIASIKRGGNSGSHCLILGATGAGKTTLLGLLASEYVIGGHAAVIAEAKTDFELEHKLRQVATDLGRPFFLVSPHGPTVWDVLATGGVDETVAKLLACEEWSEPYYLAGATRFLRWVVRGLESSGTRLTLSQILEYSNPDRLAAHVAKNGAPGVSREIDAFVKGMTPNERTEVAGLRSRLAVLAESDYGRRWLDPKPDDTSVLDLSQAIRQQAIVYFRLDAERHGIVAEKIGAAVAIELGAIASGLHGRPVPTFIGIDEYGAIESEQVDRLFARGRAAGFSVAVASHTLADFRAAGEGVEDRLKGTVDTCLCLRVGPDDADAVASLAGQVGQWQSTNRTKGPLGIPDMVGTRTRGYRLRIHPSVLQHLRWGQCAVIRLDRGGKERAQIARVVPSWERVNGSMPRRAK
jgi:hypothetical protein